MVTWYCVLEQNIMMWEHMAEKCSPHGRQKWGREKERKDLSPSDLFPPDRGNNLKF
jgi:hypothetical protein